MTRSMKAKGGVGRVSLVALKQAQLYIKRVGFKLMIKTMVHWFWKEKKKLQQLDDRKTDKACVCGFRPKPEPN